MTKVIAPVSDAHAARFAELIEEHLGLRSSSRIELKAVMAARMRALQCYGFDAYLDRLESPLSMHEELRELAVRLTIGETYFFRSPEQLKVFTKIALPLLTQSSPTRQIRILSAGCSTGEEPYTIAMAMLELGPSAWARVSILGLDINPQSLAKANRARYSPWSMRATPPDCVEKYFHRESTQYVLDQRVKAMVRFEERSLAHEDLRFWQPRRFDVVFCRNVIMHLSARVLGEVVARFARVLAPDGFLFLSHAEPLRGISQAFRVEHAEGAFYYVLREARRSPAISISSASRQRSSLIAKTTATTGPKAPECKLPLASAEVGGPAQLLPSLSLGAALMKAERFDDALATLQALAPADRVDPDVLLLTAIIQLERGKLDQAAELCASLLARDDLNAAVHYLIALCHEQGGRRAAAVDSYRAGVFLDATFAMPHLRLGLLFRREGDLPGARRELQNASMLLAQEDPARVLLFGGGFSRGTLIDLCASELRLCEASN